MDIGSAADLEPSERLVVVPLREIAANSIRRWIFAGTLSPGQILTQDEVAQRLGISRMPVREAFQVLARDGLLLLEARRRAVVRSLSRAEIIDHYEARALVEGELAARTARTFQGKGDPIVTVLRQGVDAAHDADPVKYQKATEAFHRAVWIGAKRPRLLSIADQLWTGLPPHLSEFLPEQLAGSVKEHKELVAALHTQSAASARKAMREHILQSMKRFLSRYQGGAAGIVDDDSH